MAKSYEYGGSNYVWNDEYIVRKLLQFLESEDVGNKNVFEIGCGNGYLAKRLAEQGYKVTGIDNSESGIRQANKAYPNIPLYVDDINNNLSKKYGKFPIVISLEVIEHVYSPASFMDTFVDLMDEGGLGFISTPYHGFFKNLAIVASGRFDSHFSPLWEGGHIKYFSENTLSKLLDEYPVSYSIKTAGRFPPFSKSLIAYMEKK